MAVNVTVLQRARAQLVIHEPFFATILLQLNIVECSKTPDGRDLWLAATDGETLFINPKNFEQLTVAKAKGVLRHEVEHIARLHPWRIDGRDPERWNHATDYAINPDIIAEGGELPDGVLNSPAFKGMSAEQIYAQLPPIPPKGNGGNGNGNQPGNGGNQPPSNPLANDVLPAKDNSQAAVAKAKTMVAQAANVAKARGKMPASMQAEIDELLNPKVDWREQLAQYLTETTATDYSFRRPNRRFVAGDDPMYLPSVVGTDAMESILIVLDTSGSISLDELRQGLGEVVGVISDVSPRRLIVAYCDAKVQHHDVFDNPQEAEVMATAKRHGGGGTNMPAALTWATRKFPEVKAAIVWTDGHTPFGDGDDYPFPVVWAMTTGIEAPWGSTIHVGDA